MSRLSIFNSKMELILANAILVGLSCFFSLWLIKFIINPSPLVNIVGYSILVLSIILPLVVLKFKAILKIKISMAFLGFILALYSFEYCLEFMEGHENKTSIKDKKKSTEIFDKLASEGKTHSIPVATLSLLSVINGNVSGGVKSLNGEILPISNTAQTPTFLCENANGPIVFQSDRYGFNNQDEIWNSSAISLAVLGDSYIEGVCVSRDKNILTEIIKEFPDSLNLGIVGHGPLTMLGTIKEYLKFKQPEYVVWCYSANDIYPNLSMEKENKILAKYLDENFSQDLINRQAEVDAIIDQFIKIGRNKSATPDKVVPTTSQINGKGLLNSKFVKLYRVRHKVFRSILTKMSSDYSLFDKTIKEAKKQVESWKGKMIFVYLPGPERFYKNQIDPAKERVIRIIKENDIEVVDIEVEFLKDKNPQAFFESSHSHYNEKGYQAVSAEILKSINK